jgi:hypothetical protein
MKTRLVCDALTGEQWIRDINGSLSVSALIEYVNLWAHLQTVQLDMLMPDQLNMEMDKQPAILCGLHVSWLLPHEQCGIPGTRELCEARVLPSCKFFFWFVLLGRCWTSTA